ARVARVGAALRQIGGRRVGEVALGAERLGDARVDDGARRPSERAAGVACAEVAGVAVFLAAADADMTAPATALAQRICERRAVALLRSEVLVRAGGDALVVDRRDGGPFVGRLPVVRRQPEVTGRS